MSEITFRVIKEKPTQPLQNLLLSYGSLHQRLTDKIQFPFLYQMAANEAMQNAGIVKLLTYFQWAWIGLLVSDDDSGEEFVRSLKSASVLGKDATTIQTMFWREDNESLYILKECRSWESAFIQEYQHVLALEFAVKEINENQRLLPNLTLGFSIYDSYLHAKETYQAILRLISPKDRFLPNYKCDNKGDLMAIIEELTSDISHPIVDVLCLYKILQVDCVCR
ncbi:hypothetical protein lerEdw1_012967 [Lerista edwardsae]|nr:hypothetical protein lerEdw1_012967 [Lerista edwardsae]